MTKGWSEERRARQAALIREWKPWEKTTGPKSKAGKAKTAKNAMKHGGRSRRLIAERRYIGRLLQRSKRVSNELYELGMRLRRENEAKPPTHHGRA